MNNKHIFRIGVLGFPSLEIEQAQFEQLKASKFRTKVFLEGAQ